MEKNTFEKAWQLDREIDYAKKDLKVIQDISNFCKKTLVESENPDTFRGFKNAFNHIYHMLEDQWSSKLMSQNVENYYKIIISNLAVAIEETEQECKNDIAKLEDDFKKL